MAENKVTRWLPRSQVEATIGFLSSKEYSMLDGLCPEAQRKLRDEWGRYRSYGSNVTVRVSGCGRNVQCVFSGKTTKEVDITEKMVNIVLRQFMENTTASRQQMAA
jgi:hypothetical protein